MELVTNSRDLQSACCSLKQLDFITVDTEFIRDNTYWPKLCLIQVASDIGSFAIDPLSEKLDLSPFISLLTDKKVLKVFHSARQDIEIFFNLSSIIPNPLFDTQIAAMVCGFGDSVGYDTLVRQILGRRIDKSSRLSDWSRRPLSSDQIKYALADVTHLREVYLELNTRLISSNRQLWLREELGILMDPNTYRNLPEEAWRRIKSRHSSRRYQAILKELATWRESEAQRRNVPRNRILRDETISEISAHPPQTVGDLGRLRTFPKGLGKGVDSGAIFNITTAVTKIPESELPDVIETKRAKKINGPMIDLLKVLLKAKCEEHDVAQKLVASMDDLETLATDSSRQIPALVGWRHEVFGKDALRLMQGKIALTSEEGSIKLIPI